MDLGLPPDDDAARVELRSWLAEHPRPTGRELARRGLVVPHWRAPYGIGAAPLTQLLIDEELRRAGVSRPVNPIGIGWAGPTILQAGTEAQRERWLWPLLAGEDFWCQLFSEPEAGSDLAGLRTTAVRDGEEWVISGQKVWTSYGHIARFGILLARTDPAAPKHKGISYFVCPMDAPGLEVRPLIDMTGDHAFNEVFFDEVRIPADHLIGRENEGWELAKVTLGNERVSLSGEGALWGRGPTAHDLVELVRRAGGARNPVVRDRLVSLFIEAELLRVLRLRMVSAIVAGKSPGAEASVRKAIADDHGKHVMELGRDLAGPAGTLAGTGPLSGWPEAPAAAADPQWSWGYLFSPALTIGGGTSEVQRNIIAERVLGLARELNT